MIGLVCGAMAWAASPVRASLSNFEDLSLAPNSFWSGETNGVSAFQSGGVSFRNNSFMNFGYYAWNGFAYSNVDNTNDNSYLNQYAVISGAGYGGSGNYAVGYDDGYSAGRDMIVTLPAPATVSGLYVNNTTYAALTMRDGDPYGYAKKFGGDDGTDPDWFKMIVYAYDASSALIGTNECYLADFRFDDSGQDYILTDWTFLDLSGFGSGVARLEMELDSSDKSAWGINTPTYVAMDQLAVIPEPGTLALGCGGLAAMFIRMFRRRSA
jgi:hypothetical protein